jgi:sugar/nucleoside kinase (ribokinase family)
LGHQNSYSLKPDWEGILDLINPGDFLHVSGYFMLPKLRTELLELFVETQERKTRISFDPGWDSNGFNETSRTELFQLLPHVNFFEPNEAELKAISRKPTIAESIEKLSAHYDGVVALKLGESGSRIYDRGQIIGDAKPFPTQVIDSTGAGDVFDAGFIHGIIKQQNYVEAAGIGNAAASILIGRKGAGHIRFPTFIEIANLAKY